MAGCLFMQFVMLLSIRVFLKIVQQKVLEQGGAIGKIAALTPGKRNIPVHMSIGDTALDNAAAPGAAPCDLRHKADTDAQLDEVKRSVSTAPPNDPMTRMLSRFFRKNCCLLFRAITLLPVHLPSLCGISPTNLLCRCGDGSLPK